MPCRLVHASLFSDRTAGEYVRLFIGESAARAEQRFEPALHLVALVDGSKQVHTGSSVQDSGNRKTFREAPLHPIPVGARNNTC